MIAAEVVGWRTYEHSFNQIIALKKSAQQFFSFSKVIRKGYFIYMCTCTWIYMCMCTHKHPSWNSVYVWMDTRTVYPACLLFNSQPSLINSHAVVSSLIALDNLIYQLWNLLFLLPTYPHHPTLVCPLSLHVLPFLWPPLKLSPFFALSQHLSHSLDLLTYYLPSKHICPSSLLLFDTLLQILCSYLHLSLSAFFETTLHSNSCLWPWSHGFISPIISDFKCPPSLLPHVCQSIFSSSCTFSSYS